MRTKILLLEEQFHLLSDAILPPADDLADYDKHYRSINRQNSREGKSRFKHYR